MYNLRNLNCQKLFKKHTDNTNMAKIFESSENLDKCTKKFLNYLDGSIKKCFTKHRTTIKGNNKLENLFEKRRVIKDKDETGKEELLKSVEQDIANEACDQVYENIKGLNSESGGYNPGHMWRLKSKIIPKPVQVPTAMKDPVSGQLFTDDNELKKHTVLYYKNVLRNRDIDENLEEYKKKRRTVPNEARRNSSEQNQRLDCSRTCYSPKRSQT